MNIDINTNITSNLLDLLDKTSFNPSDSMNILNVSCDVSRIYYALINKFENCRIINIEMDSFYKNNINIIPNTILGSINGINMIYCKNYFDVVIFDDSIQKFRDPWNVLKSIHSFIKKDAHLFVSIPNIMYVTALNSIIGGNFEYTNSGILNKDNLRFFTLNEVRNLFESNGYDVLEISSISSNRNNETMKFINIISPNADENLIKLFHCYQFIFKATTKRIKTLRDYVYSN